MEYDSGIFFQQNVEDNSGIFFQKKCGRYFRYFVPKKMWKILPESSSNKNLLYSMYF
jgi:hypothetical protein